LKTDNFRHHGVEDESNIVSVARPVITGPGGTSGPYGIWWLGGFSDSNNGYYDSAMLSVTRNGAPDTAHWSVIANWDKVNLSCVQCDFPLVTSAQPSANCTYDISIQVDFSGFKSAPYQLNVNAPSYLQGGLSTTNNYVDGWLTLVPYTTRDRCNYPMPSIALNETFDQFFDMTSNNWAKPSAGGITGYGGYTWWDNIFVISCGACNPPLQRDNPPGQTWIDKALQHWYIGIGVSGLGGVYVQQDMFRRYTGQGEHTDITRINN
jgi:hypothetical protein